MTTVSAQTVANEFIALAEQNGKKLTPMQALKLVYLAHGWMLGNTGEPLINDKIEAWMYGPVIPALYATVRAYRGAPIPTPLPAPQNEHLSADQKEIIKKVYTIYKDLNGVQLSNLTHQDHTPWYKVYKSKGDWAEISTDLIKDFYQKKVQSSSHGG